MTHKFFRMIILFALFHKVIAQTGSGLDTLTQVNGWRLVKYVSGVTSAKTWFSDKDAYHGRYSQFFEVSRNILDAANSRYFYAIFKKSLKKQIKKYEYFQFSYRAYSQPPVEGIPETPVMDIAFGNNGKTCDFQTVIYDRSDNWIKFPFLTDIPLDSIDCVYLKVSGSFKVTVVQIDYLIFVDPGNGFVFAVIDDFEDATITDVEKEVVIPTGYSLSQNYPNPFNPSTTIKYSIPYMASSSNHNNTDVIPSLSRDEVHVTLKIYDLLGREVATLLDEKKQAGGEYSVHFDGSHLAAGTYFYQINIGHGQFVQTKKMILMK